MRLHTEAAAGLPWAVRKDAADWLDDCGDPEAYHRGDADLARTVDRHYDGGWGGFVFDGFYSTDVGVDARRFMAGLEVDAMLGRDAS